MTRRRRADGYLVVVYIYGAARISANVVVKHNIIIDRELLTV